MNHVRGNGLDLVAGPSRLVFTVERLTFRLQKSGYLLQPSSPPPLHPSTETSALHLRLFPSVTEMKGAFHLHCSVKGCLLNSRFSVYLPLCYLTSTGYIFIYQIKSLSLRCAHKNLIFLLLIIISYLCFC